ncbi:MAG: DNA-binding protein [Oscillospiraceae bacterium]
MTKNTLFMNVTEVIEELGVSKPYAYKVIRKLNEELAAQGYLTISGKVNRKFFLEKCYGESEGLRKEI